MSHWKKSEENETWCALETRHWHGNLKLHEQVDVLKAFKDYCELRKTRSGFTNFGSTNLMRQQDKIIVTGLRQLHK